MDDRLTPSNDRIRLSRVKHRPIGRPHIVPVVLLAASMALAPRPVLAQERVALTTDAAILRVGDFRIRALSAWTRYDRLGGVPGAKGLTPIGSLFSTDSLGPLHLASLGTVESGIRELSGTSALKVSAGRLITSTEARIVVVPLMAEYGLTDRLTIGIMVPIVQARASNAVALNPRADSSVNVGPNPSALFQNQSARTTNTLVAINLQAAATQLGDLVAMCAASPTATGCPAVLSRRTEAEALIATANAFAATASDVYGVSSDQPGQPFVPIMGSPAQVAVDARLAALRSSFSSFGFSAGGDALAAAGGPATLVQLQQMLRDPRFGGGRDTLGIEERIEVGDVEIGATYQLKNTFTDSAMTVNGKRRYRHVVQAVARLGTGRAPRPNVLFDVGGGDGQTDLELRAVSDVIWSPKWMGTAAAAYTIQFGTVPRTIGASPFPLDAPPSALGNAGNALQIDLMPRYSVTRFLMFTGGYSLRHEAVRDAPVSGSLAHRALIGMSYSGFGFRYAGGARLPLELHYSRSATFASNGGPTARSSRDQLELRYYYRARR
jgi:hypothetical protein